MSSATDRRPGIAAALVAAAVALVAWWPMTRLALLGWDSYPMIAASKVGSLGELFGTFGEELMDGRYPLGRFWRPMAHLAFALDHALWGLEPFGYHLTDLVLVALTAGLITGLVGRLFGGTGRARWAAGLVAGLAWALHPVHFEILTAPPRRAESLAVCFSIWALFVHAREPLAGSLGRRVAVGLLCAAALASKEAGIAAVVAVVLCSLAAARPGDRTEDRTGPVAHLAATLRACWPAVVAVALALAARTAVLGGLGGSSHSSPTAGFANAWALVVEYSHAVLLPPNVFGRPGVVFAVGALAVLGLVAVWAALVRPAEGSRAGLRHSAAFLGLWAVALLAITGMSGIVQGWYALPFVAVFALTLGLILQRALEGGRLLVPGAAVVAAGLGVSAAGSGLFDRAGDFHAASALEVEFLERFESAVRAAGGDQLITLDACPAEVWVVRDEVIERKIFVLGPYSLEAFAELALPERYVRVSFPGLASQLPERAGEVRVGVHPRQVRFDR